MVKLYDTTYNDLIGLIQIGSLAAVVALLGLWAAIRRRTP